jgi:hypothetical protein
MDSDMHKYDCTSERQSTIINKDYEEENTKEDTGWVYFQILSTFSSSEFHCHLKCNFIFFQFQSVPVTIEVGSSWRGVLDTTLCNKICQWLATGRWFSPNTPVSSTNATWTKVLSWDRHKHDCIDSRIIWSQLKYYSILIASTNWSSPFFFNLTISG